mmetsp:Transcript_143778/g.400747  ORF Transcript_143778/g.400747 Transcript_143778/m.400747 type:complete len:240 (-) Transcript_143778:158-877(-)
MLVLPSASPCRWCPASGCRPSRPPTAALLVGGSERPAPPRSLSAPRTVGLGTAAELRAAAPRLTAEASQERWRAWLPAATGNETLDAAPRFPWDAAGGLRELQHWRRARADPPEQRRRAIRPGAGEFRGELRGEIRAAPVAAEGPPHGPAALRGFLGSRGDLRKGQARGSFLWRVRGSLLAAHPDPPERCRRVACPGAVELRGEALREARAARVAPEGPPCRRRAVLSGPDQHGGSLQE